MVITERTQWQDHDEKDHLRFRYPQWGSRSGVVHDPAVMMSLPPQSVAYTVIRNSPQARIWSRKPATLPAR